MPGSLGSIPTEPEPLDELLQGVPAHPLALPTRSLHVLLKPVQEAFDRRPVELLESQQAAPVKLPRGGV